METRFRTFNVLKDGKRFGKIMAATINTDETKQTFNVGFSFCSPKDKFDRKLGKKIAEGRANCNRSKFLLHKKDNESISDNIKKMLPNLIAFYGIPWVEISMDPIQCNFVVSEDIKIV